MHSRRLIPAPKAERVILAHQQVLGGRPMSPLGPVGDIAGTSPSPATPLVVPLSV